MKMYKKGITLVILMVLTSQYLVGQTNFSPCKDGQLLIKIFERYHLTNTTIDSSFYKQTFVKFIDNIDPEGTILNKGDFERLSSKAPTTNNGKVINCDFFEEATALYKNALEKQIRLLDSLEIAKISFVPEDTLSIKQLIWGQNQDKYDNTNQRLTKHLRLQILVEMKSIWTSSSTYDSLDFKQFSATLQEASTHVINKKKCTITYALNQKNILNDIIARAYFKAMAKNYDPHSDYFSLGEFDAFNDLLSKSSLSFGLKLHQNNKGEMIVAALAPGGPAWKSGMIKPGDELISVEFPNQKKHTFQCSELNYVNNLLNNDNDRSAFFKIKNTTGKLISTRLIKEEIQVISNKIEGLILEGEKKIGYINLPSFYMGGNSNQEHGCANDVAKEILLLKKEKINGLILDLRNNGGGSLQEAIELAGLFINEGPLCFYKEKDGKVRIHKDINRGSIYNGPLTVLINNNSASASEILAGMLQDYSQAIIVGRRSFGKSTGQIMLPLHPAVLNNNTSQGSYLKAKHYIKLTQTKFYRLNGRTIQIKGVKPDIELPEHTNWYDRRESDYSNVIPNDLVYKKLYKPLPPKFDFEPLVHLSQQRTSKQSYFQLNDERIKFLDSIPLNIFHFYETIKDVPRSFENENKESVSFKIVNHSYQLELYRINELYASINEKKQKTIQSDLVLNEAFLICLDLINFKKK